MLEGLDVVTKEKLGLQSQTFVAAQGHDRDPGKPAPK